MKKINLTKSQKELNEKLKELSKTTLTRPKEIQNDDAYQFNDYEKTKEKKPDERWVLINTNCELVGRLDYNPSNTRESARNWFFNTYRMVNQHANFDNHFRVLTIDEFDELQKVVLDNQKKETKFLDFLSRAPISFGDDDELD